MLALQNLKRIGLDDRDVRILYALIDRQSYPQIAKELKITPQAVHQRYKRRIEPKLRKLHPSDKAEMRQMLLPAGSE